MAARQRRVLLQIDGRSDSARRAVDEVRQKLRSLAREDVEARIDVNERVVTAKIDRVKERLRKLGEQEASPAVDVKTAAAFAQLDRLQLRLDRLKAERVALNVETDRSAGARLERLGTDLQRAGGSALNARPALAGLAAVLVGSLAGGLGAAATAASGAGVALGLLAAGALERFKAQAKRAGTAAADLKHNFQSFAAVFGRATAGGADAIFRGLSSALQTLGPAVRALTGSFTTLGTAAGSAFQQLASTLASPQMVDGVQRLIAGTARLLPSLARLAGGLAGAFVALANAAMPFLRQGTAWLADVVAKFAQWASSKTGTDRIQKFLQSLVPLFKSLASFSAAGAVTFFSTLQATAPLLPPLVNVLSSLLKAFNGLPGPIRGFVGALALISLAVNRSGLGSLLVLIGKVAKRFGLLSGAAADAEGAAAPAGGRIAAALLGRFRKVVSGIGGIVRSAVGAVRSAAAGVAESVGQRLGTLLSGGFGGRLRSSGGILARLKGLLGRGGPVFGALGALGGTLGAILGAGLVGALIGYLLNKIPFIRHAAQSVAAAVMGQGDLGRRDKTTNNAFDSYTKALAKLDRDHNAGKLSDAEWYRRRKQLTSSLKGNFGTGYLVGGLVRRAFGGMVPGSGHGDIVPAMLEPGEFVIRRSVVQELGLPVLHALNGGAMPRMAAAAVAAGDGVTIENINLIAPEGVPDARHAVSQLASELARRGIRL